MKNKYTKQSELGLFGYYWGCYFTCCLNIFEHILNRKLKRSEIYAIIGFICLEEKPSVRLCNYKNHKFRNEDEDEEWHFYINSLSQTIHVIAYMLGINTKSISWNLYTIKEMGFGKKRHFILDANGDKIDPSDYVTIGWEEIGTRHINLDAL